MVRGGMPRSALCRVLKKPECKGIVVVEGEVERSLARFVMIPDACAMRE